MSQPQPQEEKKEGDSKKKLKKQSINKKRVREKSQCAKDASNQREGVIMTSRQSPVWLR